MPGYIQRDVYLQKLIDSRENGSAKVVTGPRRCGKSWLLTRLYKDYLIADGVPEEDIIIVSLDMDDENNQSELADKEKLKAYLYSKITDPKRMYYVMLDEIQEKTMLMSTSPVATRNCCPKTSAPYSVTVARRSAAIRSRSKNSAPGGPNLSANCGKSITPLEECPECFA